LQNILTAQRFYKSIHIYFCFANIG